MYSLVYIHSLLYCCGVKCANVFNIVKVCSYLNFSGAIGFYETSALTGEGVSDAVSAALRAVQRNRQKFTWPWKRYGRHNYCT